MASAPICNQNTEQDKIFINPIESIDIAPTKLPEKNGNFIYVGCSGLLNLFIIRNMIDWSQEKITIPQLMIIDYSENTIKYWEELQKLISKPTDTDYVSFSKLLEKNEEYLNQVLQLDYVHHQTSLAFYRLFENMLVDQINRQFKLLRNVILKAIFHQADWTTEKCLELKEPTCDPFSKVKILQESNKELPTYIYASNIFETLRSKPEKQSILLKNIQALTPAQTVVTATSRMTFLKSGMRKADQVFYFKSSEMHRARETLTAPHLYACLSKKPLFALRKPESVTVAAVENKMGKEEIQNSNENIDLSEKKRKPASGLHIKYKDKKPRLHL